MGVQDPGESGDVVGTRCGAFPFTAFRRPDYSPSLTTLVIQRKYLLLVTLTGVLAAVTNTSQTHCLRNTSYEHYERLTLSAFISRHVQDGDGLHRRVPEQAAPRETPRRFFPSQHLPLGKSVSKHLKRRQSLETVDHGEADLGGRAGAAGQPEQWRRRELAGVRHV